MRMHPASVSRVSPSLSFSFHQFIESFSSLQRSNVGAVYCLLLCGVLFFRIPRFVFSGHSLSSSTAATVSRRRIALTQPHLLPLITAAATAGDTNELEERSSSAVLPSPVFDQWQPCVSRFSRQFVSLFVLSVFVWLFLLVALY